MIYMEKECLDLLVITNKALYLINDNRLLPKASETKKSMTRTKDFNKKQKSQKQKFLKYTEHDNRCSSYRSVRIYR